MTRRRLLVPFFASLALVATTSAQPASECASARCSCRYEHTVKEARERALEVFVGKVISLRDTSARAFPLPSRESPALIARVAVTTRWTGPTADTTTVWTFATGGLCGVPLAVGEEWLVFVDDESRQIGLCGRSVRTDKARSELRELGRPMQVRDRDSGELAVLRVVRERVLSGRPAVIAPSSTYATACDERARPTFCVNDSTYVRFPAPLSASARARLTEAAADFRRRNESPSTFSPTAVRELRVGRSITASGTCEGVGTLAFTRVGFETSMQYAVAGYVFTVGPGPYPGCGYLTAATYFLRRSSAGVWEIIGESAVRTT